MTKVIAFSDVHLGYEYTNYHEFNRFLDYVRTRDDIDKVVMVGDIFELWWHNYHSAMKEPVFSDTFYNLQETIDELAENGIGTIYLIGNHDYMVQGVIGDDLNVEYKHTYVHDDTLYKHGWEFDFAQVATIFGTLITPSFYEIITMLFPAIYQQFFRKPSEILTEAGKNDSHWINSIYTKASELASKIGLPMIVIGHTHNPTIIGNVVDCGDWIDSLSWAEIDDGIPTLHKWRETHV